MNSGQFQTTHWSVVMASGQEGALEAMNQLCRVYWQPVYVYLRRLGYTAEDSEDLTQDFLSTLLHRQRLAQVHPSKGRFRSFLIASLKNFVSHHRAKVRAQKRGGGRILLPLDDASVESTYVRDLARCESPEQVFERRWAFTLLDEVRHRLRGEYIAAGKTAFFDFLVEYLPGGQEPKPQVEIAEALGLTVSAVKSEVYRLRQRFGQFLRAEVANTVADAGEIDAELRHLIGVVSEE